jgi:acyl-CoA thioester hydrolase
MEFRHRTRIALRFADMDAFGHVNNAHYLTYIEEARVRYFDMVVNWEYDWNKQGIILAKAEVNYIRPIHFKDLITIETRCVRIGTKSMQLDYRIMKTSASADVLMAEASTILVAYDYESRQSIPVPEAWQKALTDFENGKGAVA